MEDHSDFKICSIPLATNLSLKSSVNDDRKWEDNNVCLLMQGSGTDWTSLSKPMTYK